MRNYRIIPILISMLVGAGALQAQAVLRPAPSGRGSSEVTLSYPAPSAGMAAMPGMPATPAAATPAAAAKPLVIKLDYGQPHLRGRTLHTDSLVPYDKPWRTGASEATTLTTDVDLVLGGAALAKGKYVLYTLPSKSGWKLIVQRSVGQSAMTYGDSLDVVRIDLRRATLAASVESFTMWLIPSLEPGPAKGELRFAWGTEELSTNWSIK
jgi:Protein of unknown function (DUF2911)